MNRRAWTTAAVLAAFLVASWGLLTEVWRGEWATPCPCVGGALVLIIAAFVGGYVRGRRDREF